MEDNAVCDDHGRQDQHETKEHPDVLPGIFARRHGSQYGRIELHLFLSILGLITATGCCLYATGKADAHQLLDDIRGRARIMARIERLAAGNPGDVKP